MEMRPAFVILIPLQLGSDSLDTSVIATVGRFKDYWSRLPINVIFYKPSGTFPRVAFPTIDYAWQTLE